MLGRVHTAANVLYGVMVQSGKTNARGRYIPTDWRVAKTRRRLTWRLSRGWGHLSHVAQVSEVGHAPLRFYALASSAQWADVCARCVTDFAGACPYDS